MDEIKLSKDILCFFKKGSGYVLDSNLSAEDTEESEKSFMMRMPKVEIEFGIT